MRSTNCLCCDGGISDDAKRTFHGDRRKGLKGQWLLVECSLCGAISMDPIPTDEQLASYYAAYYPNSAGVVFSRRAGSTYPLIRKFFHVVSGDVDPRDFVDIPPGARVLDYGCGHAGYLSDFHAQGVTISGAEIAQDVVDACRKAGFDVRKVDDFSHIPFGDREFDVVYLMQVFEHLRDPNGFLDELARILEKGGALYLAVPNANSVWRKVFKGNWVSGWFAPFHLCHYGSDTLAKLAARHGFDLAESWSRTPESWFRLNLKAFLYPEERMLDSKRCWLDSRLMRYFLMLLLRIAELPFGERDCLVVKLIKR